jgi:hypothetical protein
LREPLSRVAQNACGIGYAFKLSFGADEKFVEHGALGLIPSAVRHNHHDQRDRQMQIRDRLRRDLSALAAREYLRSTLDLADRLGDVDGALIRGGHAPNLARRRTMLMSPVAFLA